MSKGKMIAIIAGTAIAGSAVAAKVLEKEANKTTYKAETVDPICCIQPFICRHCFIS